MSAVQLAKNDNKKIESLFQKSLEEKKPGAAENGLFYSRFFAEKKPFYLLKILLCRKPF